MFKTPFCFTPILYFILLVLQTAFASEPPPVNTIVLQLEDFLVTCTGKTMYHYKEDAPKIELNHQDCTADPQAVRMLQRLSSFSNVKLAFLSTHNLDDAKDILSQLTLPNGRSVNDISYGLYIHNADGANLVTAAANDKSMVIAADRKKLFPSAANDNLVDVGPSYYFFPSLKDAQTSYEVQKFFGGNGFLSSEEVSRYPLTEDQFLLAKTRVVNLLGVLTLALSDQNQLAFANKIMQATKEDAKQLIEFGEAALSVVPLVNNASTAGSAIDRDLKAKLAFSEGSDFRRAVNRLGSGLTYGRKCEDFYCEFYRDTIQDSYAYGSSIDEAMAVSLYVSQLYGNINGSIRAGGEKAQAVKPLVDILNLALSNMPDYRSVVVRGATLPAKVLEEHQPGSIVTYVGFTSSAIPLDEDPNSWRQWGEHKILIHSLHGKKILQNTLEREVLFKAGTSFRVLSRNGNEIELEEIEQIE